MVAGAGAFARLGHVVKHGRRYAAAAVALVVSAFAIWWSQRDTEHYLSGGTAEFIALFAAPPVPDSAQTRRELDELLALEQSRTAADVAAAQADRRKDLGRFYMALGFDADSPPDLPQVRRLLDRVESDIGSYVRAAKTTFHRLRPYEIETRLHPCIADVRGDQSYPSGHATYGYVVTGVLEQLAPDRRRELRLRGDEFARQRMVCGVHFRSDLEAGRIAARWLIQRLDASPEFLADAAAAARELRSAGQSSHPGIASSPAESPAQSR
ncbi:MAG: phosphatase PAP2 family protein [Pseudomonadota bacterium]